MKKTLNVNVGGRSFVIDEDAYLMLRHYLDEIDIRLDGTENSEVMEDIETRIADLFQESLSSRIQVVSLSAVRHAITVLGSASEFGEPLRRSVGEESIPTEVPEASAAPAKKQRFYRSRYDRMIGGVCGGIARYYDFDPLLVRILTLIVTIFTGVTLFVYIILWIVAPMEPKRITSGEDSND